MSNIPLHAEFEQPQKATEQTPLNNPALRGLRVFVYYNLHRHCLSVKALAGADKGRVVLHADAVTLKNVTFKVSEAGRQRVLQEQRKNVHAGMVGELWDWAPLGQGPRPDWAFFAQRCAQHRTRVTYNPYKFDSFVTREGSVPVKTAPLCAAFDRAVFV